LGSGNLRLAVTLPEGEDINEWLAANSTYRSRAWLQDRARDESVLWWTPMMLIDLSVKRNRVSLGVW